MGTRDALNKNVSAPTTTTIICGFIWPSVLDIWTSEGPLEDIRMATTEINLDFLLLYTTNTENINCYGQILLLKKAS